MTSHVRACEQPRNTTKRTLFLGQPLPLIEYNVPPAKSRANKIQFNGPTETWKMIGPQSDGWDCPNALDHHRIPVYTLSCTHVRDSSRAVGEGGGGGVPGSGWRYWRRIMFLGRATSPLVTATTEAPSCDLCVHDPRSPTHH